MNQRTTALALALALALSAAASAAHAQTAEASSAVRAEAGERFDRGLRLFNGGDTAGALAEFSRAYELVPNVLVLYNIGLVYAQMGRAVEATDALDRVLASPGTLSAERRAVAQRTRNEQASRVVEIAVESTVDGATVEVDGVEAGKTPLQGPLRITGGSHVIGLIAAGFSPERKEITIAGGEKRALRFELVAMQGRLAHLAVKSHLPGAELFVDDARVGTTPFATSVTLAPGSHRVELRRPDYVTAGTNVTLGDGATGEVTLDPDEDPAAPESSKGVLALDVRETEAVVTVDGRGRGVYVQALKLPPGPHTVRVERGDFQPFERDVTLEAGRAVTVPIVLEPTPEFRAKYVSRTTTQRTWGWISVVGGAVVLGAGVGLVVYDAGQRSDGNATRTSLQSMDVKGSQQVCDPGLEATLRQTECLDPVGAATAKVNSANTRDIAAWVGVGVGAASVALGVTLLVLDDNPHKYDDAHPNSANSASPRIRALPTFWATPGGGGASVVGTF
jgi:hypothetical protein